MSDDDLLLDRPGGQDGPFMMMIGVTMCVCMVMIVTAALVVGGLKLTGKRQNASCGKQGIKTTYTVKHIAQDINGYAQGVNVAAVIVCNNGDTFTLTPS